MIIHYCWFGQSTMPKKEKKCIESWRKVFPEAEFKLWNEEIFDVHQCNFGKRLQSRL